MRLARRAGERGVIAVLTALILPLLCFVMLGVVDVGYLFLHRHELENATEAQSLAYSLYMMASPDNGALPDDNAPMLSEMLGKSTRWPGERQDWQSMLWSRNALASANMEPGLNPLNWGWWAPRSVAQFAGTFTPTAAGLLPGAGTQTLYHYTGTIVPQFQWNDFYPVRNRVILVLDYSETMQETFSGYPNVRAIEVLRDGVQRLLNGIDPGVAPYLPQRVNWGLVMFAGQVLDPVVAPVPLPNDFSMQPGLDQTLYDSKIREILLAMTRKAGRLNTSLPAGDTWSATSLQRGIDQAVALLDQHDQTGTPFTRQYLKGPTTLLIVSDGEPSYRRDGEYDVNSYQDRVDFARAAAYNSIAGSVWPKGWNTLTITTGTVIGGSTQDQVDFMRSISGGPGLNPADNAAVVNGDPGILENALGGINPKTHCLAWPQMRMPASFSSYFWATPPLDVDPVFTPGSQQGDHFFGFGGIQQSATAAREYTVARGSNFRANNFDPDADLGLTLKYPTRPTDTRFYVYPTQTGNLAPANAGTNMVELNVSFCLPHLAARQNNQLGQTAIFRARWGYPRALRQNRATWPN